MIWTLSFVFGGSSSSMTSSLPKLWEDAPSFITSISWPHLRPRYFVWSYLILSFASLEPCIPDVLPWFWLPSSCQVSSLCVCLLTPNPVRVCWIGIFDYYACLLLCSSLLLRWRGSGHSRLFILGIGKVHISCPYYFTTRRYQGFDEWLVLSFLQPLAQLLFLHPSQSLLITNLPGWVRVGELIPSRSALRIWYFTQT